MNKFLFLFVTVFFSTQLFAQENNIDTTLLINKHHFRFQISTRSNDIRILSIFRNDSIIKTDTLFAAELLNLHFPDFNKDNYSDIKLAYLGNNLMYHLYLFDKTTNSFEFIDGFESFPEAKQLMSNSKYYYSYKRAGCADMNWISDLFYIENYKAIHIGHIYGQGCNLELNENPHVINVYKITDNKQENGKLLEQVPYLKNIPSFEDKWKFIEKYWNKNYEKFHR